LLILNVQNAKAAGFTISKTIEGGAKLALDPRRARYMDINSMALVDEITAGDAGRGKRQAFYNSLDNDLLNKLWGEVISKITAYGVSGDALKWAPSMSAIEGDLRNPTLSGDVFFCIRD